MLAYLSVAVGGALGSLCRFWVAGLVAARYQSMFPWAVLIINVTGSFIIGIFAALNEANGPIGGSLSFRNFFMIGICGGYTTFSSFSLDTFRALQNGKWLYAGGNVVLSVVLCMIAVSLGYYLGRLLHTQK